MDPTQALHCITILETGYREKNRECGVLDVIFEYFLYNTVKYK